MNNSPLPDDMWVAARLIWENTMKITDAELIEQLKVNFKGNVPKSTGTISKRRKNEEWTKNTPDEARKRIEAQSDNVPTGKNFGGKKKNIPSKTNKAQKMEKSGAQEEKKGIIDGIMNDVVLDAKGRASIIHKYRRRYIKVGELFDQAIEITASIEEQADAVVVIQNELLEGTYGGEFEIGENDKSLDEIKNRADMAVDRLKKTMMLSKTLTDTAVSLATGLKMLSEVDMPMCGITAEDFKESAQDRRLGALEALGDIHSEEQEARERLKAELDDRLEWIKETANSGDFGRTPEPGDDVEDIDYTAVDD